MKDERIGQGTVVQITDEAHAWFPCYLVVTEVKTWGIQGCVLVPHSNSERDVGQAYNRLKWEQIEYVGQSPVVPA